MLHYLRAGLRITITQSYTLTMQQTHRHKAVTRRIEAKKLLSCRRQSNYSINTQCCYIHSQSGTKFTPMCIRRKTPIDYQLVSLTPMGLTPASPEKSTSLHLNICLTYAGFRLTCRSPLCRYAAWHRLLFQSCSSQRQRRFGFSPSGNRSRVE